LPVQPRTTPPPQPYGGRYSTLPALPPPAAAPANGAAPAAEQGAPEAPPANGDYGNTNGGAPQTGYAQPGAQPAAQPPAQPAVAPAAGTAPPPMLTMPPGDMPSDNPLRPVQNGGY
jgi:general secretion pathway protein D